MATGREELGFGLILFIPFVYYLNAPKPLAKKLYLMRHAEAGAKESRQDDRARELNAAGIKESRHMGAWFEEERTHFDLIVSSSALRAEQTAHLVAEGMNLEHPRILLDDSLYESSVRQLLGYINSIEDAYDNVLIVGHNPSISYIAEYLTKAEIGDMVPAGVTIIKFDLGSWKMVSENTGTLEKYVMPHDIVKY